MAIYWHHQRKESIGINGKESEFVYDYGGIIYFSDGKFLGCGMVLQPRASHNLDKKGRL
jgi:hypothetical protein